MSLDIKIKIGCTTLLRCNIFSYLVFITLTRTGLHCTVYVFLNEKKRLLEVVHKTDRVLCCKTRMLSWQEMFNLWL